MSKSAEWTEKLVYESVTISNGTSLSNFKDTYGQTLVAAIIPAALTGTKIKFQASIGDDISTFYIIRNGDGDDFELTKSADATDGYHNFNATEFIASQRIKLESNQTQTGGDCTITLVLRSI